MKHLLFAGLLAWALGSQAQTISFQSTQHNFGNIKEANGPVSHTFEFTNTGNKPLIIQNVTASCGCTTPEWPKAPIGPGQKGTIKAQFDPLNREGQFNKNITISSNATNGQQQLFILGTVEKKPAELADYYRQKLGPLNFKSTYAAFTSLKNTESQTQTVEMVNLGEKPVVLTVASQLPYIEIQPAQLSLKKGEKGSLQVIANGRLIKEYGYSLNQVQLKMDGVADPSYKIMVSTNVFEDFAGLSPEQRKNAPIASFENEKVEDMGQGNVRVTVDYDFGVAKSGAKVEHVFRLQNNGKSDLIIRQTKASCGCTAIAPSKLVIKPGESSEIKAIFDTTGRTGPQSKSITVTVNDPQRPNIKLFVRGKIE